MESERSFISPPSHSSPVKGEDVNARAKPVEAGINEKDGQHAPGTGTAGKGVRPKSLHA